MKRIFAGIVIMGLVLSVGDISAFAAEPGSGRYYADTDGNGICDYYAEGQRTGSGFQGRRGRNYIDTDGDGFCDNYIAGQCQGGGYGCGTGGRGDGFRGGHGR